jgi:hypothetical protein
LDPAKNAIVSWLEENQPDVLELVADELDKLGYKTITSGDLSGNWIEVVLQNGSLVMFGNTNPYWGGEIYKDAEAIVTGDPTDSRSMGIRSNKTDPKIIAEAFIETFGK